MIEIFENIVIGEVRKTFKYTLGKYYLGMREIWV